MEGKNKSKKRLFEENKFRRKLEGIVRTNYEAVKVDGITISKYHRYAWLNTNDLSPEVIDKLRENNIKIWNIWAGYANVKIGVEQDI